MYQYLYQNKRVKKGDRWEWGPKGSPLLDIELNEGVDAITDKVLNISLRDGKKINEETFIYFCERLRESGDKVFPEAKSIVADVKRRGRFPCKEVGHIGPIAISSSGYVDIRRVDILEVEGDFSLALGDICPNILIIRDGSLTISGPGDNSYYNLDDKSILCDRSIRIAGQNVRLPDKLQLSYSSLGISDSCVIAPGGIHDTLYDMCIENSFVTVIDGKGSCLNIEKEIRLANARFACTPIIPDNEGDGKRKIDFPFSSIKADVAIIRNASKEMQENTKVTARKVYTDFKRGVTNYCYEGVREMTIKEVKEIPLDKKSSYANTTLTRTPSIQP